MDALPYHQLLVQYDYSEADTGNHSRLTKITYPDGYELDYNYATGVDDNISRLTSISDASGTLEAYSYQGDGTVLTVDRTQPGLNLATTLDDFGRISDFNWANSGGSVSRYAYGYDAAGNRLYKEDTRRKGVRTLYKRVLTPFLRALGGFEALAIEDRRRALCCLTCLVTHRSTPTISRRLYFAGRPPNLGSGTRRAIKRHCSSLKSVG